MASLINSFKYRFARKSDVDRLANLHWSASTSQPSSFMFKLGVNFLKRYYEIILLEKYSVILCAIDKNEVIQGFVSGSLDNKERMISLNRHKTYLFLALIPQLFRTPSLFQEILSRFYSRSAEKGTGYIVQDGPHEDFWAWDVNNKAGNEAILLHVSWLNIVKNMGIDFVHGEVDLDNLDILKIHKFLGAKIIREYNTPDGRKRLIFKYNLLEIE